MRSLLRTTPEYAILIFGIVTILILSVAPLGDRIAGIFGKFSHDGGRFAPSQDESTKIESSRIGPQSVARKPVAPGWMIALQLAAVSVTCAWLLLRVRSRRDSHTPRPVDADKSLTESQRMFEKRQQILKVITENRDVLLRGQLEVWHLATRQPITVTPDQTVEATLAMMEKNGAEHLLVCAADRTLVGLVSKHYLVRSDANRVADAMVAQPPIVAPNAMLNPTETYMLNEGVSCVAVVKDGKAVGTMTTADIQLTLQVALQILARTTTDDLSDDPC